ncbi:MAG: tetratricopeptide repeat protein [Acidobacteriota bacterium]
MTTFKMQAVTVITRLALRYPRFTWWVAQRIGPWVVRRFWRVRLAAEEQAAAVLMQELRQATDRNDTDWQDVQALGELCIRQRAYAEAARHFQRVAGAADNRELRRSAAAWLGRALEYAGDRHGAHRAYRAYLRDFPEVGQFERQRLERRLAELNVSPNVSDDVQHLPPNLPAGERPSRISVGRRLL